MKHLRSNKFANEKKKKLPAVSILLHSHYLSLVLSIKYCSTIK